MGIQALVRIFPQLHAVQKHGECKRIPFCVKNRSSCILLLQLCLASVIGIKNHGTRFGTDKHRKISCNGKHQHQKCSRTMPDGASCLPGQHAGNKVILIGAQRLLLPVPVLHSLYQHEHKHHTCRGASARTDKGKRYAGRRKHSGNTADI